MIQLSHPSPELVARLSKELEYDQQLKGVIMNPMGGTTDRAIFTFKDACNFLHIDPVDELMSPGGKGSVRYIDLGVLQNWLREVFGDEELADAISEEVAREEFYGKQLPGVKELMLQRLNQCNIA